MTEHEGGRRVVEDELSTNDEGFTLVETMVAIVLVTIALFALTAELAAYLHHQANERSRTTAVRAMTTTLETIRALPASSLRNIPIGSQQAQSVAGVPGGTLDEYLERCLVTDPLGTCTATSASSPLVDTRVRVTVSWLDGGVRKSVSTYTSVGDASQGKYSPTGSGTLASLTGGAAQTATSVSVSSFTASPTSAYVSPSGTPTSAITLNLVTVGLTAATSSIAVTWTDDAGSHQTTLTGGPNSWTGVVPAASISKTVSSGTASLTFAATVPGTSALPTTTVTLRPAVSFTSCSVTPNPIVLTLITRKTTLTETLTCSATGLAATDTVSVSYASGASTASKSLTSSDGATWSTTIAAGTAMASSGLSESFTFTATRASDSATATNVTSAVLA